MFLMIPGFRFGNMKTKKKKKNCIISFPGRFIGNFIASGNEFYVDYKDTVRKGEKTMNIYEIEKLTLQEVEEIALEKMEYKGLCGSPYKIFFADLGEYFGYSMLVFWNNRLLKGANDYALHHPNKTQEEFKKLYIESLKNKLFNNADFERCKNYDDFQAKEYFIRNRICEMFPHYSMFFIGSDAEREERKKEIENNGFKYLSKIGFCYYDDIFPIELERNLLKKLQYANEKNKKTPEYWRKAFLKEMYNHEYCYNWQADYDTLSAFGNIQWKGENENALNDYMDQLNFDIMKKQAYLDARKQYFKEIGDDF